MNRDLIAQKAKLMASQISSVLGTRAYFRGETIMLAIAQQDSTLAEVAGNFRESASWRIRMPATVQPPPDLKEKIVEIGTGREFFIVGVRPAPTDGVLAQEHIIDAELA